MKTWMPKTFDGSAINNFPYTKRLGYDKDSAGK